MYVDQNWIGDLSGWLIGGIIAGMTALAAFLASVVSIRKNGWVPFKKKYLTPLKTRRENYQKVITMGEQVAEILREVKPNGGGSLRDHVNYMREQVDDLTALRIHQNESSDRPFLRFNEEGHLTYTNAAFRDLVETDDEQLVFNKYLSRMDDTSRVQFIEALEQGKRFKIPVDIVVNFRTHGGHTAKVRLLLSPDVRHMGTLKGFFATAMSVETE